MGILDPVLEAYMPRFIQIESGGNPNARTGSYSGLLQMGPDEIARYGSDSLDAGRQMYADRAQWFADKYGRPPTPTELYLTNQQGEGGVAAHMANPDAPAWQNMYSTGEGQKKGEAWAKKAIWGNVPDDVKANYPGGVDSLTSKQFMDLWQAKVERGATQMAAAPSGQPFGQPSQAPQRPLPPQPLNLASPQPQLPAYGFTPQAQAAVPDITPQQLQQLQFAARKPIDMARFQQTLAQLRSIYRG